MRHDQQVAAVRLVLAACLAGLLAAGAAGCVSSTLEADDFRPVGGQTAANPSAQPVQNGQPQALTSQTPPQNAVGAAPPAGSSDGTASEGVADPAKRQQALDEIRAKAAASSGEKTQIGAVPGSATQQLSEQEQADMAAQLENSRRATGAELSDAEIKARKAAIRRLQQKGKTHYERALDSIEN